MENSKIEWTDATFNPWEGCRKVSPACKNCYAETRANRFGKDFAGTRTKTSDGYWRQPLKWNRKAEQCPDRCKDCHHRVDATKIIAAGLACPNCEGSRFEPHRPRVFCASLADVFEDWSGPIHDHNGNELRTNCNGLLSDDVWFGTVDEARKQDKSYPWHRRANMDDLRIALFRLIDATPHLDWLLLTKRPENIPFMSPPRFREDCDRCGGDGCDPDEWMKGFGMAPCPCRACLYRSNVWLGTTAEDQKNSDLRVPELFKSRVLSPVLFLSCEPLLGPLDLSGCFSDIPDCDFDPGIDWVIAGGESGPHARPTHPDWYRSLRDQCASAGVPLHFKQWGEWYPLHGTGEWRADDDEEVTPFCWIDHSGRVTSSGSPPDKIMVRVGKKKAGRLLDGVEHNGLPEPTVQHARTARKGEESQ